jgi:lipoprotein-anchoring transpeptidase ErfK/SrfK
LSSAWQYSFALPFLCARETPSSPMPTPTQVPRGGKFVPSPMLYFMQFHGADGMHVGYLPGYPASHGCVRTPETYAIAFLNAVEVGTTVTVFGRTSVNRYYSGQ